ncbi:MULTISPECIES: dephospho-CoA kinase [Nitrosomonas]|uniref:dephospho-CoA kinase n=1 Tax=Nitrosomonas TaxID=914 RepID=UPI001938CB46|nr:MULTISPECIES: dephospho-CoA kinase [Nitrosomonas]MBV6389457.1 Dephospho-CoA kinase [Nitrosomonas europaea]MEB2331094.1 dephospho-CoA kinase [Nitrosomonas sp.]QOJ09160.1 MAG: dephospho-CoA kinase [Nitrosomonas sp. H1_AOB3]HNR09657.1 dephospho-CoA kinase [Nitrosomonas europaea]HNS57984.1 dephospho-CoA kinase [Nitrosomonas europaea]
MALIIGLTGGIGSGKTRAADSFRELGIEIIDTDQIAHELTRSAGKAISPIRIAFGDCFILDDGSLDRSAMRRLVFSDETARHRLESILHPLIYQETLQRLPLIQSEYGIVVVPLLLEIDGYLKLVDRVLVIDCPEPLQISRTMLRSKLSEQEVRDVMAVQCSRDERLAQADDVIVNDSGEQHLQRQVEELHRKYLMLARKHGL